MRDTMRDGIPPTATARLFLICALALIGAFVRPGASAEVAPTAAFVSACAVPDRAGSLIAPSAREGVLRDERARGVCAAAQPARGGPRPGVAAPVRPRSLAIASPPHDAAAHRPPRDRAHAARAPPFAAA